MHKDIVDTRKRLVGNRIILTAQSIEGEKLSMVLDSSMTSHSDIICLLLEAVNVLAKNEILRGVNRDIIYSDIVSYLQEVSDYYNFKIEK